jgi:acetylornithine deacetylase
MIEGGSASNILARDALVTWEYRALPGRDAEAIVARVQQRAEREILPKYRKRAPEARLETVLHASYPGLAMDETSPAVRAALTLSGANHAEAVSYGTEAGHFQRAGIPSVICGPGSIEQAHKADEFVALAQLEACGQFLDKVIAKACAA